MIEQKLIKREFYNQKIEPFIGRNVIKVLTGQRRTGKSFLLQQITDFVKQNDRKTKIISINKELYDFDFIRNYVDLQKYFDQCYDSKVNNFLFVDEIQEIEDFQKCIRNIFASGKADIYITGSNADVLSGELATLLSGRYVECRVFPLSYNEYLKFHQKENSKPHFEEYLHYGGLPGLINLVENDTVITDYLKGIYSTILFKDVVARYQIRNVPFLQNLVKYLADITGNIISAKKISDYLKSQKLQVSPNIVMDYIKYLESAFFISKASRTDIFGKKIFEIGEKYYFEDLGLRNIITGYKMTDINKILENVVYNHLCIAGYNVHVGVSGQKEIDFICEKKGEKIYVQVCYLLAEQDTINREFGNLLEIRDNYPKYVVTMDESTFTNSYEGIIQINVRDFCLSLVS